MLGIDQRERSQRKSLFEAQPQRNAARDDDGQVLRCREQCVEELRGLGDVLEIIEQKERPRAFDRIGDVGCRVFGPRATHFGCERNRRGDGVGVASRRNVDDDDPFERSNDVARELPRERGLPDARRPEHRHQSRAVVEQARARCGQFVCASEEAVQAASGTVAQPIRLPARFRERSTKASRGRPVRVRAPRPTARASWCAASARPRTRCR